MRFNNWTSNSKFFINLVNIAAQQLIKNNDDTAIFYIAEPPAPDGHS